MRLARSLAWTGFVLFFGSMYFGAEHTGTFLLPALHVLAPVTGLHAHELHALLRKAAHFTEFAVLAVLWFQALAGRRRALAASWIALAICLACAVADEAHQSRLPNRTASARDVVIDASGAVVALSVMCRRWQRRDAHARSFPSPLPYAEAA
jgi:VanZ family protein